MDWLDYVNFICMSWNFKNLIWKQYDFGLTECHLEKGLEI